MEGWLTSPKVKPFHFTRMGNLWICVQVRMFPTPKKSRHLNYFKRRAPITGETHPINSYKEFMALPLHPRMNWQNISNKSKKQKKETIELWEKTCGSSILMKW